MKLIDVRKFIIFGVLSNILSRVHCYPIKLHIQSEDDHELTTKITKYLNGMHHMDSLLIRFQMSYKQLMQALERSKIDFVYK